MERNKIYHGNNLDILRTFPDNSIDSIVTDPPYGISFMNKKWDYDVPTVEFWIEALRVLKPGGHALVACGTRTQHRMAVNLEDAGFEIRDIVAWVYGSGFPKSHDISKAIDKKGGNPLIVDEISQAIKKARLDRGLTFKYCDEKYCNGSTNWSWYEGRKGLARVPDVNTFNKICEEFQELSIYKEDIQELEREEIGTITRTKGVGIPAEGKDLDRSQYEHKITSATSDNAKQWQGWGTALKPAMELWTLCRKPLQGTVANNVLKYGVGGINIDGCRVAFGDETDSRVGTDVKRGDSLKYKYHGIDFEVLKRYENDEDYVWSENLNLSKITIDNINEFLEGLNMVGYQFQFDLTQYEEIIIDTHLKHIIPVVDTFKNNLDSNSMFGVSGKGVQMYKNDGRFPANFIHDGSEEVVKLFPSDEEVSAARFFYTAKASQTERNWGLDGFESKFTASAEFRPNHMEKAIEGESGNPYGRWQPKKNIHPTVKPIELMRYLVRLITPKGGVCLDPFMGSGTTAVACKAEKFDYIGCELEAEYIKISEARIKAEVVVYDIFDFT